MAAFGSSSGTTQDRANSYVYDGAIDAGYTPAAGLAGEVGIAAGVVACMLTDAIPFPAGTSAAPGVAFNGDSDLGFFRVAANELGVSASGANVGGWTASGIKMGSTSSSVMSKFTVYSVSLTPAAITAVSGVQEQTFTVTGITASDIVYVNPPAGAQAAAKNTGSLYWRVSSADALTACYVAFASVSTTPAAGTHKIVAIVN